MTQAARSPAGEAMPWAAALATFALTLFHPGVLNDGDMFWHVATGGWIIDDRFAVVHARLFGGHCPAAPAHTAH
ncbi:MAG: hypothetical protein WC284_15595 [Candidimonas sp.]